MRFLSCVAALAAVSAGTSGQDTPAPGFALAPAAFTGASSFDAATSLANGQYVVFDGQDVVQYASDGSLLVVLGSLPAQTFASFVVADPTETFVCFGESSNGNIYRLALGVSGTPELLATLAFNYDAVVWSGQLYVSAATCGFFCGNEIWRVDLATHAATLEAQVDGASGPLAATLNGDLYYGSVSGSFPPPPDSAAVWRWSRAQLEGSQVLALSDAAPIGMGFEGAARMAYDPHRREVYLAEVNFATGENRLVRVQGDASQSPVLLEGRPFFAIGSLQLHAEVGPARFLPYQPEVGGTLSYTTTDFSAPPERNHLRPRRPAASLTRPAPRQLELTLQSGPSGGFARVLVGPRGLLPSTERAFVLKGLPMILGLDQGTQTLVPGLHALDAAGSLSLTLQDPAGIGGTLAFQLWIFDSNQRPAGTSSVAVL